MSFGFHYFFCFGGGCLAYLTGPDCAGARVSGFPWGAGQEGRACAVAASEPPARARSRLVPPARRPRRHGGRRAPSPAGAAAGGWDPARSLHRGARGRLRSEPEPE